MRPFKSELKCLRTKRERHKRAALSFEYVFVISLAHSRARESVGMSVRLCVCLCEWCMICIMVCDTAVLEKFIDT